jgi:hypothetical protein
VCDLAKLLTAGQLRRTLARYPFPDIAPPAADAAGAGDDTPDDPDGDTTDPVPDDDACDRGSGQTSDSPQPGIAGLPGPDGPPVTQRIWWGIGDDGVFRMHLECDPVAGMILEAAINEARDALFQRGHTDVTDVDAIIEMAERSLGTVESPARRDRFRTNIHHDTSGAATDARGWTLPDAIRRYITCDGLLSPVFLDGSIPISVGRTQRMIPQRTRLLVLLRDQSCRIPGCNETHHLEVHHIIHWEDDGTTDTWNLIALCPRHHRMHHRGELGIHGNADTPDSVTFTNRHGRPIGSTGARPQPPGPRRQPRPGSTDTPSANASTTGGSTSTRRPDTAPPPGRTTPTTPSEPADTADRDRRPSS